MSDEDSLFARIALDFIDPIGEPPPMPVRRWERYRELFRGVHSDAGLVRRYDRSVLIFGRKSGILGKGARYSYVYFPTAPPPDKVLPRLSVANADSPFYRSLGGNWYLLQDRDD